jgi:membrane protein implicated in regulation of membrane protease activity
MKFRLIWAIISIILEEAAIVIIALIVLPEFDIEISVTPLVLIMIAWLVMSVLLYLIGIRALDKKLIDGPEAIVGKRGTVVRALNPKGLVKINGELWGAESKDNIDVGEEIIVTHHSGIKLIVERCNTGVFDESK